VEKQRIRKILVPLDGSKNSQRGLESAIHLAKEHEASLTAIHVIHDIHGAKGRQELELEEEMPPSFILLAKKLASKNGIPFYTRVLTGDPGHEIVNYANTHSMDLIVIGARGLSAFKKIFLGSVSSYVMHTAKAAVMVIK
jgi:nucleotide-binding universal stress UspA family protein